MMQLKNLSFSSSCTLHTCPRKFELTKLIPKFSREESIHTTYGKVVGEAVQAVFANVKSRTAIVMDMFLNWNLSLLEEDSKSRKSFYYAVIALDKFIALHRAEFYDYEVAKFKGKPATELSMRIDLGDGFFLRGFADVILYHGTRGMYKVAEIKTTGSRYVIEAQYKNSPQAVGYSTILDAISEKFQYKYDSSYEISYIVYKTYLMEWEHLPFPKSKLERAKWIKNVLLDKEEIQKGIKQGYFPMHGESCSAFGRPCKFFDLCTLSNHALVPPNEMYEEQLERERPANFAFNFSINDLIEVQLEDI